MFSYSCAAEHLFGLWTSEEQQLVPTYILEIAEKFPQQFEGNMRMSVVNASCSQKSQ
jgi:hypothetical protein